MTEPKLRFHDENGNGYPKWVFYSISSIGDVITGSTPSTTDSSNYGDEYLFVSPADLGKSKYIEDSIKRLSAKGFAQTRQIPKGSILATCIGSTIGKIGIAGRLLATNQQINSIVVSSKHNSDFVYYALDKAFPSFMENVGKQAVPILSKSVFQSLGFNIPCLEEENKIGSFLSVVDEKIALKQKKYDALQEAKKGLLQKIFSQEIRFRKDDGGEYPEWNLKYLGDISRIRTGKLDVNAQNPNGKYRFYTCDKDFYMIDEYAFDTEAILISGNGSRVGHIHYFKGKFNAYQRTYVIDDFKDNVFYIKAYLERYLSDVIRKEKKAGNIPYIVLPMLSRFEIMLPSLDEQQKIADFLSTFDEKIEIAKNELDCWKTIKKGLLQQMFC